MTGMALRSMATGAVARQVLAPQPPAWIMGVPGSGAPGVAGPAPFALSEVVLLEGPFEAARARDIRSLLALDPERLLHDFRAEAGRPARHSADCGAMPPEVAAAPCAAYTLGRYLSACSLAWAGTREAALRQRVDHVVNELRACQHAAGRGWGGAFSCAEPPTGDTLAVVLALDRAPWHGVQRLLAGLRDAHLHARLPRALLVLARLADRIDEAVRSCDDGRMLQLLCQEHRGMGEVLADLFSFTGQRRTLRLAQRISGGAVLEMRSPRRDLPATARIGELTALVRLGEVAGGLRALKSSLRDGPASGPFTCDGLDDDLHSTGDAPATGLPGHSDDLLRLARMLFAAEPLATNADCQERVLFNRVVAAGDACAGLTESIYAQQDDVLYVNQFIASRLDWSARHLQLRQETRFPEESATRISLSCPRRTRFTMRLRHPSWCARLSVSINGRAFLDSEVPGRYVEIERLWADGDVVDVQMPTHSHLRPMAGPVATVACMVGPVVVATCSENDLDRLPQAIAHERFDLHWQRP